MLHKLHKTFNINETLFIYKLPCLNKNVKKLEKSNLIEELSQQLQKMEKVGKVDTSVVNTLDNLVESCHSIENFWRDNDKIPIQNSFMLYHASRNARIILKKMKQRLIEARERHENPIVVEQSLAIIPSLSELCAIVSALTKQVPTKALVDIVSQKVEYLRDVAFINGLLPTPEEEMKELDQKRLKKCFGQFADTLQAMFV